MQRKRIDQPRIAWQHLKNIKNVGMRKDQISVTAIIKGVIEEMCDKYCKYPEEWDPEKHDGQELFDSEICANCPLNRL